jgi:hypothetical protein
MPVTGNVELRREKNGQVANYIEVSCDDCGKVWSKRITCLPKCTGLCRSCFAHTPEGHAQRVQSGHIGGKRYVELYGTPGTLEGCRKGGRRTIELHGNPSTPEGCRKGGRRTIELHGNPGTPEGRRKGGHIAGRINGPTNGRIAGLKAIKSGYLARVCRGVPTVVDGILFKSRTEAKFYAVIKALGGEPEYEPVTILLPDGRSYTPDFRLGESVLGIPAGVLIELKPSRKKSYYTSSIEKAKKASVLILYADELWN